MEYKFLIVSTILLAFLSALCTRKSINYIKDKHRIKGLVYSSLSLFLFMGMCLLMTLIMKGNILNYLYLCCMISLCINIIISFVDGVLR